jgi:DNA-binding transcriptional ArsR family regulator
MKYKFNHIDCQEKIKVFPKEGNSMLPWTFVTNHAVVLSFMAQHPMITGHELALEVGISERAIRKIIADLYQGGYIAKGKEGRRVRYQVKHHVHLRHKTQKDKVVADLLKVLSGQRQKEKK